MGYRYTNYVEGGQVIESDEPVDYLEGQALWEREIIGNADPALTPVVHEADESMPFGTVEVPTFAETVVGTIPTEEELAKTPPAIVTDASGTVHGDSKTIPTLPVGEPVPGPFEVLKFLKGDDNAKGEPVDRTFDTFEDASAFADEQSLSDPLYSYTAVPKSADDGAQG